MLNDFLTILKNAANVVVNFFGNVANILIANPLLLIGGLFLILTNDKSIQIGKIFKAKG